MLNPERRFPEVPKGKLDSFPGRYVLLLKDRELLPSPEHLRCYRLPGQDPNSSQIVCFPTSQAFFNASESERADLRQWLGGDYAYNYGIMVNGRIVGLPMDGSSHMALLGDAPKSMTIAICSMVMMVAASTYALLMAMWPCKSSPKGSAAKSSMVELTS